MVGYITTTTTSSGTFSIHPPVRNLTHTHTDVSAAAAAAAAKWRTLNRCTGKQRTSDIRQLLFRSANLFIYAVGSIELPLLLRLVLFTRELLVQEQFLHTHQSS